MMGPEEEDYADIQGHSELLLALIRWIARQMKAEGAGAEDETAGLVMPIFATYELKAKVVEWL